MAECRRCGNCCDCGTIWVNSEHPLIVAVREFVFLSGATCDAGQCEMLAFEDDGKTTCMIEKFLGREWKPETCKEHQGDKRCGGVGEVTD